MMRRARSTEHAKLEAPAEVASAQAPVEARREQQQPAGVQAMVVTVVRGVEARREVVGMQACRRRC